MKWYEIIGLVVLWILGLFMRGKFYDYKRKRYFNDSWKDRPKKI